MTYAQHRAEWKRHSTEALMHLRYSKTNGYDKSDELALYKTHDRIANRHYRIAEEISEQEQKHSMEQR